MPRGSVLIYTGSVWHSGAENKTDVKRYGVNIDWNVAWHVASLTLTLTLTLNQLVILTYTNGRHTLTGTSLAVAPCTRELIRTRSRDTCGPRLTLPSLLAGMGARSRALGVGVQAEARGEPISLGAAVDRKELAPKYPEAHRLHPGRSDVLHVWFL